MKEIVPAPLDPDEIKANLKTERIGKNVIVYKSTSSTNDLAWQYAKDRKNDGVAIFTEEQDAGRGRGNNRWLSATGQSVLCSILLLDCGLAAELLTLTCAVAVAETVGRFGRYEARIKWPNDIILNEKKVAGILVEAKTTKGSTDYVLGIGINCHQRPETLPEEIKDTATSIDIESKTTCNRNLLARRLLVAIDDWLIAAKPGSEKVVDKWCRLSTLLHRRVTLQYNNRKFSGNCMGIDPLKGLILQLDRGGTRFFNAAHTSIVKTE